MFNSIRRQARNYMVKRYSTDNTPIAMKLYGEQFAYGHREVLLDYCGYSRDLLFQAHIPHGKISPNHLDPIQKVFDLGGNPVLQLLWRDDSRDEAMKLGIMNVEPIGATFLYHLANVGRSKEQIQETLWELTSAFQWPASLDEQTQHLMRSNSILYMPMHSWDGDVRLHIIPSNSPLLKIPSERVTVMLGFLDYCDPKTRAVYTNFGWKITCAGARSSKVTGSPAGGRSEFLGNLYDIFSEHEAVVSDEFTTGLLYAMCIGRSVGVLNHSEKLDLAYSSWQSQEDFNSRVSQFRQHYKWLHGNDFGPQNVYNDVSQALGVSSFREKSYFIENVPMEKFLTRYG